MAQGQPIRKATSDIPDKLYFRIGEVSRICEVPAYVLRFWESEFTPLRPNKGGTGQRLYRRRDVETALRIKRLLYDEGYTIPGARQILKIEAKQKAGPQLPLDVGTGLPADTRQHLEALKAELSSLLSLLTAPPSKSPRPLSKPTRHRSQPLARLEPVPAPRHDTLFDLPSLVVPDTAAAPHIAPNPEATPDPEPDRASQPR